MIQATHIAYQAVIAKMPEYVIFPGIAECPGKRGTLRAHPEPDLQEGTGSCEDEKRRAV